MERGIFTWVQRDKVSVVQKHSPGVVVDCAYRVGVSVGVGVAIVVASPILGLSLAVGVVYLVRIIDIY